MCLVLSIINEKGVGFLHKAGLNDQQSAHKICKMSSTNIKPDTEENLKVHVDKSDEGKNSGGEGGMPNKRQGVPGSYCHHHHPLSPSLSSSLLS